MFVIIQRKAGNVIMLLSRCDGISDSVCPCNPVDVCFETFKGPTHVRVWLASPARLGFQ
jgi:hypothetical protein